MRSMEIKITNIAQSTIYLVETDESEYPNYIRYGTNSWMQSIGESDEPIYDCAWIEQLFQDMISKQRLS